MHLDIASGTLLQKRERPKYWGGVDWAHFLGPKAQQAQLSLVTLDL